MGAKLILACIKFISKGQTIRVKTSAGAEEEYVISGVEVSTKSQAKSVAGLADGLAGLAIGQNDFEVYEMDWRTKVILEEGSQDKAAPPETGNAGDKAVSKTVSDLSSRH
jgi:hypothetical protein